jgi:hypothetical protein
VYLDENLRPVGTEAGDDGAHDEDGGNEND